MITLSDSASLRAWLRRTAIALTKAVAILVREIVISDERLTLMTSL